MRSCWLSVPDELGLRPGGGGADRVGRGGESERERGRGESEREGGRGREACTCTRSYYTEHCTCVEVHIKYMQQ